MQADVWAYPEPEVRVSLDLEKMSEVGISLDQIIQSVQASSQNIPGGSVDAGERRFNIRTSGDYESLEDIRRTIVSSSGTRLVYLDDVSNVEMDYEDDTHIGRFNGERSVFVTVAQREQANIYSVMLISRNKDIDWERVTGLAEKLNTERVTYLGLYLAHKICCVELPTSVLRAIKRHPNIDSLARKVLNYLFRSGPSFSSLQYHRVRAGLLQRGHERALYGLYLFNRKARKISHSLIGG